MGSITCISRTQHQLVKRQCQKVVDERLIDGKRRHDVISRELARQGSTFQVDPVEYEPVAVEPHQTSKKCLVAPIWPRTSIVPLLLVGGGVGDGLEHGRHVVAAHGHAMAGAADEAELDSGDGVKGCEHLLVTLCVNDNICQ